MDDPTLEDLLSEKEEEITRLKEELIERDENLAKAGELGNGLLEQISNLEEMLERMQQEHVNAVEDYEQEKYSLESKLELMTKLKAQLEANLQEETQRSKTEISQIEIQGRRKHSDRICRLTKQLEEVNVQLQQEKLTCAQRLDTIELKDAQIQQLQKDLRQMQTSLNDTLSSEVAEITNENCDLKLKLQEMEMNEHELSQMVEKLKEMLELSNSNEESLRQAKEDVEKEASSYYNSLESCKEECRELQVELDMLKLQPNDPNSRGNSLFAEVEDKRVQAEKNLIRMTSRYKCMQSQNEQLKHYALKLKMQISALLETRSRTSDQQHVRALEESLSIARSDNSKFLQKLKMMQKKLQQVHGQPLAEDMDINNSSAVLQFFKNELKEKSSEAKRLMEELRLNQLYLMSEAKKVSSLERELYDQGRRLDIANSASFKLQVEVDRLKMKCGEDVKVKTYQHKWKSEKINKVVQETVPPESESCIKQEDKENENPKDKELLPTSSDGQGCIEGPELSKHQGEPRQPLAERPIEIQSETEVELCVSEKHKGQTQDAIAPEPVTPDGKTNSDVLKSMPSKVHKIDRNRVTTAADCNQQ